MPGEGGLGQPLRASAAPHEPDAEPEELRTLKAELAEVKGKIEALETAISRAEEDLKGEQNKEERVELRKAIAADKQRLDTLEKRVSKIEDKIDRLTNPAGAAALAAEAMDKLADLVNKGFTGVGLKLHEIQESNPKGIETRHLTPSTASQNEVTTTALLRALGLNHDPLHPPPPKYTRVGDGEEWTFTFKWSDVTDADADDAGGSDRALEKTSYEPVVKFLCGIGCCAYCVADGERLTGTDKNLFKTDIYTLRPKDPRIHGQAVHRIHTVSGRTDVVILMRDYMAEGHTKIEPMMVKVLIEIKTAEAMKRSTSRKPCRREAAIQLVGINAANYWRSPPVIMTNLANVHYVLYLVRVEGVAHEYNIVDQECDSFASAVHFALKIADRECVTADFSRRATPPPGQDDE